MSKEKAFTLIELLVVIAIIGLLATIVLVSLNTARSKARDTRRKADLHQLQIALEMSYDIRGYYPGDDGCNNDRSNCDATCGWDCGGYVYTNLVYTRSSNF